MIRWERDIALTIIGSIVLPAILSLGGYWVTGHIESQKRKTALLDEFAKSYSAYLTLTQEYYYQVCLKDPELKGRGRNVEKQRAKLREEKNLVLKKKMLEISQPDGLLVLVQATFNGKRLNEECERLSRLTEDIASHCSCETSTAALESDIANATAHYKNTLKLMAKSI